MHGTWVVLLIEAEDDATEELGAWLARAGYWVLTCAGPLAPTYTCPGGLGESCPLAKLADVVVLDLRLDSDTMMEGTPSWQLLLYYLSIGKAVVALTEPGQPVSLLSDERVVFLPGRPQRTELLTAVRSLLGVTTPARLPARASTIPLRGPTKAASSKPAVIDLTDAEPERREAPQEAGRPATDRTGRKAIADVTDVWL